MQYFTALFTFLFSFFGLAFIIGLALLMIFPTKGPAVVGIGMDWRNLPGTLLGLWAGVHGWKTVMRKAREKEERNKQS
jgi:hypothetical protein